jgi:hypothetical protein
VFTLNFFAEPAGASQGSLPKETDPIPPPFHIDPEVLKDLHNWNKHHADAQLPLPSSRKSARRLS